MRIKKNDARKVYLKTIRQWMEMDEEVYYAYQRPIDAHRKRIQYHGRCFCPKNEIWKCDGDCGLCRHSRAGDMASLDEKVGREGGIPLARRIQKLRLSFLLEGQMRPVRRVVRTEGLALERQVPPRHLAVQRQVQWRGLPDAARHGGGTGRGIRECGQQATPKARGSLRCLAPSHGCRLGD